MKILVVREYLSRTAYCEHNVMVDDEDYPLLASYSWSRVEYGYYCATVPDISLPGKNRSVRMHRYIIGCYDHREVHHIDFNKNNHQKKNLVACIKSEHCLMHKGNPSRKRKIDPRFEPIKIFSLDWSGSADFCHLYP